MHRVELLLARESHVISLQSSVVAKTKPAKTNCYMVHQPGSPEPSDLTVMEKEFFRFFGSQPLQISVAACFPRFGEGELCQTNAHKSDR